MNTAPFRPVVGYLVTRPDGRQTIAPKGHPLWTRDAKPMPPWKPGARKLLDFGWEPSNLRLLLPNEIVDLYAEALELTKPVHDARLKAHPRTPPHDFLSFQLSLVRACESARAYSAGSDPHKAVRDRNRAATDNRKKMAAAARTLAAATKRYGNAISLILGAAVTESGICLAGHHHSENGPPVLSLPVSQTAAFGSLLAKIEGVMASQPDLNFGGLSNFATANLIYSKPRYSVHDADKPEATGLIFELALRLRSFTGPAITDSDGVTHAPHPTLGLSGSSMPAGGRPFWPIVAKLAKAALGTNLGGEGAKNRIRDLLHRDPSVRLGNWPRPGRRSARTV